MTNATFQIGKKYEMRFIGDADLRPQYTCVKTTKTTATFSGEGEMITKKIKISAERNQYISFGSYATISTKNII